MIYASEVKIGFACDLHCDLRWRTSPNWTDDEVHVDLMDVHKIGRLWRWRKLSLQSHARRQTSDVSVALNYAYALFRHRRRCLCLSVRPSVRHKPVPCEDKCS